MVEDLDREARREGVGLGRHVGEKGVGLVGDVALQKRSGGTLEAGILDTSEARFRAKHGTDHAAPTNYGPAIEDAEDVAGGDSANEAAAAGNTSPHSSYPRSVSQLVAD